MQKLVYDGLQSCPYREGQVARMPLYRQLRLLTLVEADERFANAERRVGACLYQTACPTCTACMGIRIPVDTFRPSRSQRRVLSRWGDRFRVDVGKVSFRQDKLDLFNRHKVERGLTTTDHEQMEPVGYVGWLVHSCFHTIEMRYFFEDQLVGVGIMDLGLRSASSVYFYFGPEHSRLSPGVFSILQEIEFCRRSGREHLYLGLYVEDCRHLSYKASYGPHERLVGGHWRSMS